MSGVKPCADCHTNDGLLEIRRRFLCGECFAKYVNSKVLKRMEPYRSQNMVGDHRPKLLLPLSGGPSSLALLHVLDTQLQWQREKYQQDVRFGIAYDLVLLHVQAPHQTSSVEIAAKWRDRLAARYPSYEFLPILSLHEIFQVDSTIEADIKHIGISRTDGDDDQTFLTKTFQRTKTPTARSDLQEIFLRRMIVATARTHNCDGVVWGHSDSKLAAKVLASVAKGRGGAVPNSITDGVSPYGIVFNYPLRDLFRTELDLYLEATVDDRQELLLAGHTNADTPISIRHTSIDSLLNTYITSQGEKYPGIMANVVRTAGKLQVPEPASSTACLLCAMPVTNNITTSSICYGCERMRQDITTG